MRAAKALVILGSSLTALAVARDAHRHGLRPIVIARHAGIACESRRVLAPASGDANTDLLDLVLRYGAPDHALVATDDDVLRFVASQRAKIDDAYGLVLHPANPVLAAFLEKHRFADWCACNGFRTPRTWRPGTQARPAGLMFPLMLRPNATARSGPGATLPKAVEARSENDLQAWLARFEVHGVEPVVSESLLSEDLIQYSVPFARSGCRMSSFVARKIRPGPRACLQGSYVRLSPNGAIEDLGRQLAIRANYFGIGEVEILHAPAVGRSYLIEVNPRPWLQFGLARAAGKDFLGEVLGMALTYRSPRRQHAWINFRDDRAVVVSGSAGFRRSGLASVAEYLWSLAVADVYAVFDWFDPAPFGAVLAETSRRARRRLAKPFGGRRGLREVARNLLRRPAG